MVTLGRLLTSGVIIVGSQWRNDRGACLFNSVKIHRTCHNSNPGHAIYSVTSYQFVLRGTLSHTDSYFFTPDLSDKSQFITIETIRLNKRLHVSDAADVDVHVDGLHFFLKVSIWFYWLTKTVKCEWRKNNALLKKLYIPNSWKTYNTNILDQNSVFWTIKNVPVSYIPKS